MGSWSMRHAVPKVTATRAGRMRGMPWCMPLATVEMQGYLFAARLAMAELLAAQGEHAEAEWLRQQASKLREVVEERYWLEEAGFYAFALDGQKRQVASISSHPGHPPRCGLADHP